MGRGIVDKSPAVILEARLFASKRLEKWKEQLSKKGWKPSRRVKIEPERAERELCNPRED